MILIIIFIEQFINSRNHNIFRYNKVKNKRIFSNKISIGRDMTVCRPMQNVIKNRIENGKTIEQMADELCPSLKHGERKIIREIRRHPDLGVKFLLNDDDAKKINYDNTSLKNELKRKAEMEEVQKIAEATKAEKELLTELITEFKEKNKVEDDGKSWNTIIKYCFDDINIPKTAVRLNKKYPEKIETLSICLDNFKMTEAIVELYNEYPVTWKKTIMELLNDIKGD